MKRSLTILTLLGALCSLAAPFATTASAQDAAAPAGNTTKPAAKKSTKKPAKKTSGKKSAAKKAAAVDEDDREPDITGSKSIDYQCELGNKVTIFRNDADNEHIALRWNKRLARLTKVNTTTGADRYENRSRGLVWIGIPAKSMLLDAKKGHQLANECKTEEQTAQPAKAAPESAEAPATTAPKQ